MQMKPTKLLCLLLSLPFVSLLVNAEEVKVKACENEIGVEFFTPRTVHITKHPVGKTMTHQSMVVIAKPQEVKVRRGESGSEVTVSSDEVTVRVNKKTGRIDFQSRKIKNLLSAQSYTVEPIT